MVIRDSGKTLPGSLVVPDSATNSVVTLYNPSYAAEGLAVIPIWIDESQISCPANQLLAIIAAKLELGRSNMRIDSSFRNHQFFGQLP